MPAAAGDHAAELCHLLLEAPFEAMRSGKGELAGDAFDGPATAALRLLGLPLEYDKDEEDGPWTVTVEIPGNLPWDPKRQIAALPAEATALLDAAGEAGQLLHGFAKVLTVAECWAGL